MRVLFSVVAAVLNILTGLLTLLAFVFGHMETGGAIVGGVFLAMAALNMVAIGFGARLPRRPKPSSEANIFD